MSKIAVAFAVAASTASAASAQSRGPVVPNYQDPSKQAPAAAAAPARSDDVDLVGPTAAQQARAKAAAEAKAKAEAEAKARAEAEKKAKAEVEAKAAAEEAKQKALEAVLAQRRAAEEARAAARAAAEAKKLARDQAQAAAREEARARKAEEEAKAQARALLLARKRDEAKCGRGKIAKACLAAVAAKYEAPALPLTAAPAADALAIAPLVPAGASAGSRPLLMPGSPTPPPPAKPLDTLREGDRSVLLPPGTPAPTAVASAPAPAPQPAAPPIAAATLPVARDEQQRRPRAADVVNDLQIGPQSLILDRLQARGEIVPGGVQLDFGYRLAIDDATAAHHLFSLGISSACCAADPCGLRWFARGGLGPHGSGNYGVDRRVNGAAVTQTDALGWSADVLQLGLGYAGSSLFVQGDVQIEGLSADYVQDIRSANPPGVSGSLLQWRMRGTAGLSRGAFVGQVRIAGYAYGGDPTAKFKNVPVRGALVEDDLPGLAGALQSFSARAEGSLQVRPGTDVSASLAYLGYVGPTWSSAAIFAASVGQKLGRFRLALGLVYELESDAQGNGYPTLFGTGSLGASF